MADGKTFDLAVIGGGLGGLAAAGLAAKAGLRVVLLEAHTKLGGCAGWFGRGPYTFDAGATALIGVGPGEPVGDLVASLGVTGFEPVTTCAYRVCLPDRDVRIVSDPAAFEAEIERAFPGHGAAMRRFWRLQAWAGEHLFAAASRVPRLPAGGPGDVLHDLRILGPGGIGAASLCLLTVRDVLRLLGLDRDRAFVAFLGMLLQDTAQAGPETVPFANAAAALQAYRRGMARPRGGMRSLADGLGDAFTRHGGDLRTAALVDRVETGERGGFIVRPRRRGGDMTARRVVFNLPIDRAAKLLDRPLAGRLARDERRSRAVWSACTAYLAIDRDAVPDEAPLFHQVLRAYDGPAHDANNALVSLSPVDDPGYGPTGVRVATMSTHVRPEDWERLPPDALQARREAMADRLLAALRRALPDAPDRLAHAEFATPRSFARYTRRADGRVGGPPVSRRNSNQLAVGPGTLGPGLWLVGDSVFPGQGTMAVVLSAIRVVERITGRGWSDLRRPASATIGHAAR